MALEENVEDTSKEKSGHKPLSGDLTVEEMLNESGTKVALGH